MLVDSHCHLDYLEGDGQDLDAIVARARRNGIGTMVTIGTKMREFHKTLAIAERYENIFCTVGVHPHESEKEPAVDVAKLVEIAAHPKVIGIGETGLDYYYKHSPKQVQQDSFRRHIAAARETQLPLVVHTRDADDDTIEILHEEYAKGAFPGLIHCFTSSMELAEKSIEIGFKISISGIVTFKSATAIQKTVQNLDLVDLLVETDAPFLAPVPLRGKKNEPSFILHTAKKIAELKGKSSQEVARITSRNFFALFKKAGPPG